MKGRALLIAVLCLAVAGGGRRWRAARAVPSPAQRELPQPCRVALASGPQETDIDRAIAELQERARQPHGGQQALEQLGYQFVTRARLTNDAGNYTLAENAAACLESLHPNEPAALLVRGHALHQLHRFHEAEAIARRLVATREFVLDYGLLGDALMEQGRLTEAAAAYQHMIDLKPCYQSYTRAAHLRWLKGDVEGAIDLMRRAVRAAGPRSGDSLAWADTRLALYELQRGNLSDAAAAADEALAAQREYPAALLARGRVLLARGRVRDAVTVLERAAALNPLPEYQWLLADALRGDGRQAAARRIERDLLATGAESDPRTFALFLATRRTSVETAIALADRELR